MVIGIPMSYNNPLVIFGFFRIQIKTMDKKQFLKIQRAYDATVRDFFAGINPFDEVPDNFKNSIAFKAFLRETDPEVTGSSAPDIKDFLQPSSGQKCLDAGCCANLATKRFDKWPSTYYGIDISPDLVQAMSNFVTEASIKIGGLVISDIKNIPFPDNFFDLAMVIGVFEYVSMDYAARALKELHRVLVPGARIVLDLPNLSHPHINTMFQLEEYLQRPNIPKSRKKFESYLKPLFSIAKTNEKHVMLKYFARKKK
jgi:ubiquinone/menaquinone biosynthesis C-methylase UbiE